MAIVLFEPATLGAQELSAGGELDLGGTGPLTCPKLFADKPHRGLRMRVRQHQIIGTMVAMATVAGTQEAAAQIPPPIVSISGEWVPPAGVELPQEVQDLVPPADREFQTAIFDAAVNVPIRLSDRAVLLPGVRYGLLIPSDSGTVVNLDDPQFHTVTAQLLFSYQFNSSWSMVLQVAPSLAGDFSNVEGDHFRLAGMGLVSYRFSPRFELGAGVAATYRFGGLLPVPVMRLNWQISKTVQFDAVLPAMLNLTWQPHNRFELGIAGSIIGQSFAVTSDNVQQRWPCRAEDSDNPDTPFDELVADNDRCFDRLAFSRGEIGPVASVRLFGSVWFSVRASFLFLRRFEFLNADNETPDVGDITVDRALSLISTIQLRIPNS